MKTYRNRKLKGKQSLYALVIPYECEIAHVEMVLPCPRRAGEGGEGSQGVQCLQPLQ